MGEFCLLVEMHRKGLRLRSRLVSVNNKNSIILHSLLKLIMVDLEKVDPEPELVVLPGPPAATPSLLPGTGEGPEGPQGAPPATLDTAGREVS